MTYMHSEERIQVWVSHCIIGRICLPRKGLERHAGSPPHLLRTYSRGFQAAGRPRKQTRIEALALLNRQVSWV
jgi:hypothetical protein